MSTQPNRSFSLPSPPSTTSLASSSSHSSSSFHSSSHSQKQTTQRHPHHGYSSYPSTPLASFFPPPSSSSSFFPEVLSSFPADSTRRSRRATTSSGCGGDLDAFGMGGFFVEGSSSSLGDARGSWGWIGAGESEDEEGESSEDESELEEEQGKRSLSISFQEVSWGRKVEEQPESPMLETTFGWAEEDEGNKARVEVGVKEVEDEEEDAHSLLAYLPSPTGTFQHVEHEDGLLRSFSFNNLNLLDITQEDRRAAKELNRGAGEKVGSGAGGWRDWIGV